MAEYEPKFRKILDDNNVTLDELNKTLCGYFKKLKDKKFTMKELGLPSYVKAIENPEAWVTKAMAKKRPELLNIAEEHLTPLLKEADEQVRNGLIRYNTAKMSLTYISQLRLLSAIE